MTYQCPHCSRPIVGTEAFCPHCGGRLSMGRVEPSSPVAAPAIATTPQRGGSRALIIVGLVIALAVLVGVGFQMLRQQAADILGSVSSAIPTVRATLRPAASVIVPLDEYQAAMGEAVSLQDGSGADLGDVSVLSGKKYSKVGDYLTAEPGRIFAGAKVRYVARSEFSYNLFDWVAHDDEGNQYQQSGYSLEPSLNSGTLAAGRKVEGWVSFDVPKSTEHLWVDYQTFDGTVIFSVPLF